MLVRRVIAILFYILAIAIGFCDKYYDVAGLGSLLLLILAFVLFGLASYLLSTNAKKKEQKAQQKQNKDISFLKEFWNQIRVDLDKCEFINQSYTEERPDVDEEMEGLDNVFDLERDLVNVQVNCFTIRYTYYDEKGYKQTFISPPLYHDQTTMLFKMAMQKTTAIYIDPEDDEKYYFDLEFLEK